MKGFVITLISITLVMLLVTLSSVLHNNHLKMERALSGPQPLIYAGFMFDAVSVGLNDILGPEMELYQKNDSLGILIQDSLPGKNHSEELTDYEDFLEGYLADSANVVFDLNLTNISHEVLINKKYSYENNESMVFTSESGTDAYSYEINITVREIRENLTLFDFNSSGDLNLTLNYVDKNGSLTESGKLFSNSLNQFTADYPAGKSLEIEIGKIMGNDGSLEITPNGVEANVSFFVLLPPMEETDQAGYQYNTSMEYLQGRIMMNRSLGK